MEEENNQPASGENDGMEVITVKLGNVFDSGDTLWNFRFRGKEIARLRKYVCPEKPDDCGVDYTLYKVPKGYRVLVCKWSKFGSRKKRYYMLAKKIKDWNDKNWYPLKGHVLTASEVASLCPEIWEEAIKSGAV